MPHPATSSAQQHADFIAGLLRQVFRVLVDIMHKPDARLEDRQRAAALLLDIGVFRFVDCLALCELRSDMLDRFSNAELYAIIYNLPLAEQQLLNEAVDDSLADNADNDQVVGDDCALNTDLNAVSVGSDININGGDTISNGSAITDTDQVCDSTLSNAAPIPARAAPVRRRLASRVKRRSSAARSSHQSTRPEYARLPRPCSTGPPARRRRRSATSRTTSFSAQPGGERKRCFVKRNQTGPLPAAQADLHSGLRPTLRPARTSGIMARPGCSHSTVFPSAFRHQGTPMLARSASLTTRQMFVPADTGHWLTSSLPSAPATACGLASTPASQPGNHHGAPWRIEAHGVLRKGFRRQVAGRPA